MMRVLINTPAVHKAKFALDGVPTDFDAMPTLTVTTADGSTIPATAERSATGTYSWQMLGHPTVELLTLTWVGTVLSMPAALTTYAEIVGGYYAAVDDVRAADASLADADADDIIAAINEAEDEAERIMGRAFVRRYRRDANLRVDDCGCVTTRMAHVAALRKITATLFGDAVTIAATDCRIVGDSTVWTGLPCGSLVTLDYEHGLDGDVPRGVIGAVKIRARQYVQGSNSRVPLYSERVVIDPNGASVTRMLPGTTRTGVAEVDAVYGRYALGFGIA